MFLALQKRLGDRVRQVARERFDADLPAVAFQYPPRLELGDLALTAPFDLARALRRPPREIARELASALEGTEGVRSAEVAGGGYVNLFLDRGAFARSLLEGAAAGARDEPERPRVIVEHTSINPNKAAHIGHLRNAVLGDTLVRVLRYRGYPVGVQNYIDDTGVQVADVVVGFERLEGLGVEQVRALTRGERFDYYCWDLYARVGDYYAGGAERRGAQAETLHAIEAGGNDTARLAELVADAIVGCHLATMARLGIRYELLAHESDILRLHFWERAFELLQAAGAVRRESEGKNAGCWVLAMDRAGDGSSLDEDKILVRSNGTVTYTGKDIAYQLWKLGLLDRDFRYRLYRKDPDGHELWTTTTEGGGTPPAGFGGAPVVFNVIDTGQSYPQRVVRAGVAALRGEEAASGCHHLGYEKVVLSRATAAALGYELGEDGGVVKVSGRKGLGVKADDLIDALEAKAQAEIDARDPGRDTQARDRSAHDIAVGALRYFLLRFGRTRVITFDMEEALAFTGETGPYIQNGVVRARNILAKLQTEGHDLDALRSRGRSLDLGKTLVGEEGDEVWSLLRLFARTEEVADQAIAAEDVSLVARHAFAIAQAFHAYYQRPGRSVLHAEDDERRAFRSLVVEAFVHQMLELCGLLGIPVPERM